MAMINNPLDKKADLKTIRKLYQDGFIKPEAFQAAQAVLRSPADWFIWAGQLLLFIGSALVLSGIIFFFAYNWDKMGRFYKLGLLEGLILACAVSSQWLWRKKLEAKVLLLSAAVLVGVLMAVYGQIYQTGADAYELFTGWAALIFGWVLVCEFAALWFVWLVILNTGLIFYWVQVGHPAHEYSYELLWLALAGLNGAALIFRELGALAKLEWLNGRWLRIILFMALLLALSIPTTQLIVDWHVTGILWLSAGIWIVAAGLGYWLYRFRWLDFLVLGLIVMNACYLLITLIGKNLFDYVEHEEAGTYLLMAMIILAIVSAAALWLRLLAQKIKKTGQGGLQ